MFGCSELWPFRHASANLREVSRTRNYVVDAAQTGYFLSNSLLAENPDILGCILAFFLSRGRLRDLLEGGQPVQGTSPSSIAARHEAVGIGVKAFGRNGLRLTCSRNEKALGPIGQRACSERSRGERI